MSTWTDEKHKNVREAVERFRGEDGVLGVPPSLMGDALDEIERLRALTTSTDSAHEALEKLRLWLEDARENHPRFAGETGLFLLMLERFKADHYPEEEA